MIWLCVCSNTDYRERVAVLRAVKDPALLFSEWKKILPSVIKEEKRSVYMIERSEMEAQADEAISALSLENCFAVTLLDSDYPEALKAIPDPPLVLFGRGNRALLSKRKFSIVGSRITPPWAEKQAKLIAEALSERFAVVTGFAEGGDRAAINGALASGNLISVLPLGLDGCYPASHASLKTQVEKKGLLLSEYPLGTDLKKYHFHARNRILAGLSEGVLLVSAREKKSGALITASYAAEFGRDVFAFPYNVGAAQGSGCNELIKRGAYLVTGVADILDCYGIVLSEKKAVSLSPDEQRILELLREGGELHAVQLAERSGLPVYAIAAVLSSLELKNLAVKAGGNRYSAL